MGNYRSTSDLKKAALQFSGELVDGTSAYDSIALTYINSLYQGLLAGGSEFGIDVSEAWSWAKSRSPLVLTLKSAYETGTITLTNASRDFVLSGAPSLSLEGYLLIVEGYDERYFIRYQSSTLGSLDGPWLGDSGTFNLKAVKLDYELVDDSIVIDDYNRLIDFNEGGADVLATLSKGVYSPATLATQVKTKLELVSPNTRTYTITFNTLTRKFTIAVNTGNLNLKFATGASAAYNAGTALGYDCEDLTGSLSYQAPNVLNAIQRLIAPITIYKNTELISTSAEESGKIFGLDYNSMIMHYPLTQLLQGIPERFCEVENRDNGIKKIRFDKYVQLDTRAEIDFIPVDRDLKDNAASIPKVPISFREYLVYGATYKLLVDKSDNKAETFLQLAKAKLQALINHERSGVELTNKNFGKIIPRNYQKRAFWRLD